MVERKRSHRDLLGVAGRLQREVNSVGMGPPPPDVSGFQRTWLDQFDEIVTFEPLRAASRSLFANAYYARAVEEAFKCLNNAVKKRSGLPRLDGDALMRRAFSADNPVMKLNSLRSTSDKDEQRGYMDLYAGGMTGIRNPRAHEHRLEDTPESALEMLTIANHLMRKLESSRRSRIQKSRASTRRR
ncbi:MAG: TIGR02391 family protein [Chloroflexi bacterium]|nr:TIGR02391 family protein [Chloroflexota bacterium]